MTGRFVTTVHQNHTARPRHVNINAHWKKLGPFLAAIRRMSTPLVGSVRQTANTLTALFPWWEVTIAGCFFCLGLFANVATTPAKPASPTPRKACNSCAAKRAAAQRAKQAQAEPEPAMSPEPDPAFTPAKEG